ncbi:MAG TPA: hypothetical protein VJS16_04995 [Gammaproteobacteria bacterium]|nr:hypothetical protein [Gammaproteobacteria bacterium]
MAKPVNHNATGQTSKWNPETGIAGCERLHFAKQRPHRGFTRSQSSNTCRPERFQINPHYAVASVSSETG